MRDEIRNRYFEWLFEIVCKNRFSKSTSYRKLLMTLHGTEFRYTIPRDINRADDGINLRYRFLMENGYEDYFHDYITGPCSVLEMIIALSLRFEENIMADTNYGDRTAQWFWGMINNLGLGSMYDDRYDKAYVVETIDRFLDREYSPDGKGGLFTIRNCKEDLRDIEIWKQVNWYLSSII